MNNKLSIRDLVYSALFAAITAVLSFVSIPLPFSPVPITGQTFGVMLAGCILTTRQAALSMLTFTLLGIAGAPVFAGGKSGIGVVFGPRGGYIIGFLIGAIVIAFIKGRQYADGRSGRRRAEAGGYMDFLKLGLANFVGGVLVVYAVGVIWLNAVTRMGLQKAVIAGALPFIPGDLFKVAVATIVGVAVRKQLKFLLKS